ncbi:MAG: peptide chain release factor 3 [Nitrospira sp.]|nr:peptide chain release factor 3 [Nitrospira sp.]
MTTLQLKQEIRSESSKRRTFAIISHPDAGKTTLTEKLLLYSGLVRTAGMVGGRKNRKMAMSDWMEMEQERGISITASAMQFPYKQAVINVLDTPGHQDFCEDTYRTLTAADSAIMVIDAAKGVETQTRKLFEVCRLRQIPVLTFINKMDLPGRSPLDLMSEVEDVLGIHASPINWPIGSGQDFLGVVNRQTRMVLLYTKTASGGAAKPDLMELSLDDPSVKSRIAGYIWDELMHDLELLDIAGNPFTKDDFQNGKVTPVFFGSAMTNFGVEAFFDAFVDLAPSAHGRLADAPDGRELMIDPVDTPFSAYVFKLQANMNPRHRDSTAFLRVCSGRFERDVVVKHHRTNTEVRLSRPHSMVAKERNTVDVAYPGDVIGIINPGIFQIGDTISVADGFNYKPLPQFQPEVFARVRPTDTTMRKSFDKGIEQLAREGTIQILRSLDGLEFFVAAVGKLQFDVLEFRLQSEYRVKVVVDVLPYESSAWLVGNVETFKPPSDAFVVRDSRDRPVVLFRSSWSKSFAGERNPDHSFRDMG